MKDKINFKLFKPFGSTLAKATLPLELIKDFKEDLKKIREDTQKQKDHNWGDRLVGSVSQELLITPEVLLKWKRAFFDPIIVSYTNAHFKFNKIQNILIHSAWYVISKPGDYNPLHRHTEYIHPNYHLSCVGYLQIPNMISTKNAKEFNDFSGQTEFVEGSEGMFCDVTYRADLKERDWILFPNTLSHIVYPYDTKDENKERISFSFNATINFDKDNAPTN